MVIHTYSLDEAWGGSEELAHPLSPKPRFSVRKSEYFFGFCIFDRMYNTYNGNFKTRSEARSWVRGISKNLNPLPTLRPVKRRKLGLDIKPKPDNPLIPTHKKILKALRDNPLLGAKAIGEKLKVTASMVYTVAKNYNIDFKKRREERRVLILEAVRQDPDCSIKKLAEIFEVGPTYVRDLINSTQVIPRVVREELLALIYQDLKAGLRWREICEKRKVQDHQISDAAKKFGWKYLGGNRGGKRAKNITPDKEAIIVDLLKNTDLSFDEIKEQAGVRWKSAMTQVAKKHGLRGYIAKEGPSDFQKRMNEKIEYIVKITKDNPNIKNYVIGSVLHMSHETIRKYRKKAEKQLVEA